MTSQHTLPAEPTKQADSANVADDVIAGGSPEGGLLPDVRYRVERPLRASWTGPGWDRIVVEVSGPSAFLGLRDMRADEPFAPLLVFAGYWRGGVEGTGGGELPAPAPGDSPGPVDEDPPPSPAPTEWFPMPPAGFASPGSVPGGRVIEVPGGRPAPRPYVLNANTGLPFSVGQSVLLGLFLNPDPSGEEGLSPPQNTVVNKYRKLMALTANASALVIFQGAGTWHPGVAPPYPAGRDETSRAPPRRLLRGEPARVEVVRVAQGFHRWLQLVAPRGAAVHPDDPPYFPEPQLSRPFRKSPKSSS